MKTKLRIPREWQYVFWFAGGAVIAMTIYAIHLGVMDMKFTVPSALYWMLLSWSGWAVFFPIFFGAPYVVFLMYRLFNKIYRILRWHE